MKFRKLVINDPKELIYSYAPQPVETARCLKIGQGSVYPELNLTLPEGGALINRATLPDLQRRYADAVRDALQRAVELHCEGLTVEFETLLEMTLDPFIGTEITKRMNDVCEEFYEKYGLKSEIRLTPNDTRDFDSPPRMRTGRYLENILKLLDEGSKAGGDLLSIESTGGKEIGDEALQKCDIQQIVFALAVLGVRDMKFLWKKIIQIAGNNRKIAAGDTACGFGNTAMILAEKRFIPRVFAAVVRIVSVVRSLVAVEEGATGPDKDCAYEGPYLKAITGIPISMEGKTSACAHLTPVGNVSAACADLWSNESVPNIMLLGGMAPTVYLEQLWYDCRLMNTASSRGRETALVLRDLLVDSDIPHDPQALILAPNNVIEISKAIVQGKNYVEGAVMGAEKGLEIIEAARSDGSLNLPEKEAVWIQKIREGLEKTPREEGALVARVMPYLKKDKVILSEYGL